eukprot:5960297-Prymnesium_polylepis.1
MLALTHPLASPGACGALLPSGREGRGCRQRPAVNTHNDVVTPVWRRRLWSLAARIPRAIEMRRRRRVAHIVAAWAASARSNAILQR